MQQQNLIESYKSISNLTGEMVMAATAGDWDGLIELELSCRRKIEALKLMKEGAIMDPEERKQKTEVIKKILADDARIRALTEPWMHSLHSILSASYKGKQLAMTYKQDEPAE